jgi:uncharacterized Fe-S cluster-containing MiaB family protein
MQWDPKLPLLDNWIPNGIIHIQQKNKIFAFQNYNVGNKNIKENMAFFPIYDTIKPALVTTSIKLQSNQL